MTKMLIDLADHVDSKNTKLPIRRKSSLKKRKVKKNIANNRRVTWDEGHRGELLDLIDDKNLDTKSWNKPRKASACETNLSLRNTRFALCSITDTTNEIKEEEIEFEVENDILNLNLCESDQLEIEERKITKVQSYQYSDDLEGLINDNLTMKSKTSDGSRKKRKRRSRKNTIKINDTNYFGNIANEIEEAKSFSPMGKLEKEKAKRQRRVNQTDKDECFSEFSLASPTGKYSQNDGEFRINPPKSPSRGMQESILHKEHVLKIMESLSQIEKDL